MDVDKDDLRRFREFVDQKIDDIAIAGRNSASWNGRDVIAPQDLPITKGLQERMREFDKLDEADEIRQLLRGAVRRPPADVTFSEETEDMLPEVFGESASRWPGPSGSSTRMSQTVDRALGARVRLFRMLL